MDLMKKSLAYWQKQLHLTVFRGENLPFATWKYTVVVTVDHATPYKVVLGKTGDNPNLRHTLSLADAKPSSRIVVEVFREDKNTAQPKNSGLWGSSTSRLSEILPNCGKGVFDLVLKPIESACPGIRARKPTGSHVNVACIKVLLDLAPLSGSLDYMTAAYQIQRGLSSTISFQDLISLWSKDDDPVPVTVDNSPIPISAPSDQVSPVPADEDLNVSPRHKVVRHTGSSRPRPTPFYTMSPQSTLGSVVDEASTAIWHMSIPMFYTTRAPHSPLEHWLFQSFLHSALPYYRALKEADSDNDYEKIMNDLDKHWKSMTGCLIALFAIFATILLSASSPVLRVDEMAVRVCGVASMFISGGLFLNVSFMLWFTGTDMHTFKRRTLGLCKSYVPFCILCRLPGFCCLFGTITLAIFLCIVLGPMLLVFRTIYFCVMGLVAVTLLSLVLPSFVHKP